MKFSLYSSNPKPLNHCWIEGHVKREFFELSSVLKIPVLEKSPLSNQIKYKPPVCVYLLGVS